MKISAFVACSVDGFIARGNGSVDWLTHGNSDYGYQAYFDSVDALVIGRQTYEAACQLDPWPYGFKRVLVLSRNYVEIAQPLVRFVESTQLAPATLVGGLAQAGVRHLSVDGGMVIQSFIQAGLLRQMTITRIPLLLGSGVPLFGPATGEVPLHQASLQSFDGAVDQCTYLLKATER